MKNNLWNKTTVATLAGLFLLLVGVIVFYLVSGFSGNFVYSITLIGIAALILIFGAVYFILVARGKIQPTEPNYRTLFIVGVVFMVLGLAGEGTRAFFVIGLVLIAVGLANRSKWRREPKWSELPRVHRYLKIAALIFLGLLVLVGLITWLAFDQNESPVVTSFQECREAGFPTSGRFPGECVADGQVFKEAVVVTERQLLVTGDSGPIYRGVRDGLPFLSQALRLIIQICGDASWTD